MPAAMRSMGMRRPITPVEATSTCCSSRPSFVAASAAMRAASSTPCAPVATFELPELATMARAVPFAARSRVSRTGSPTTALRV